MGSKEKLNALFGKAGVGFFPDAQQPKMGDPLDSADRIACATLIGCAVLFIDESKTREHFLASLRLSLETGVWSEASGETRLASDAEIKQLGFTLAPPRDTECLLTCGGRGCGDACSLAAGHDGPHMCKDAADKRDADLRARDTK